MTNGVSGAAGSTGDMPPTAAAREKSAVNKETFLQLLVAQIKNQNPLNPTDGVQFLTQLAQFSELEQMMGIRDDLAGIRKDLAAPQAEETGANNV
jgi:flagellar basal-body rod modification protein FlgD